MKTYVLPVEAEQEDGRWSAVVPTLSGCATWGDTREEAIDSLEEAAKAYLEVMAEEGRVPSDDITVLMEEAIAVSL